MEIHILVTVSYVLSALSERDLHEVIEHMKQLLLNRKHLKSL